MTQFLRNVWTWLFVLFTTEREEAPNSGPSAPPDKPTRRDLQEAHFGHFYFREKILDQLDIYFRLIYRMRRADPDAYQLYRRIGAHIVGEFIAARSWLDTPDAALLSPWWEANRPAFGAVFFDAPPSTHSITRGADDKCIPSMLYFQKFNCKKAPTHMERRGSGDIYVVTIYFDDEKHGGAPLEFGVHIGVDASVAILKTRQTTTRNFRVKRGAERHTITMRQSQWGIHPFYKRWAQEVEKTPEAFLLMFFIWTANLYERANSSMVRVDVSKGDTHAVFGVDILRTPYFFKDRDTVTASDGKRKRIFHIVRPHNRSNGATVRLHFRGARAFTWNGYQVAVSTPGYHHHDIANFDVAASSMEKDEPTPVGSMGPSATASWLRQKVLLKLIAPPNKKKHRKWKQAA